ncbi:putative quinol monooxygenase [Paramuribaculum intestinale]|uniref:putative quinol monooxygenase n=1 Tax=Paramuribaculum intestinale TaxID=2094151 RepID=UPI00272D1B07|nr:putative quinol monooxygenase [Paramuribaculum intestinale]
MIRLNVFLLIEEESNRRPLIEAATRLTELSLHDKGCISYDIYGSLTVDNHLMICETWNDRADLEQHMATDHFRTIVPQLQQLATMTMEEFTF